MFTSGEAYRGPVELGDILISRHVQTSPEAHTAFTLIGTGVFFSGAERPASDADASAASIPQVQIE